MRDKRKRAIEKRKMKSYMKNVGLSRTAIFMFKSSHSAVRNNLSLPRKDRRIRAMVKVCAQRAYKEKRSLR